MAEGTWWCGEGGSLSQDSSVETIDELPALKAVLNSDTEGECSPVFTSLVSVSCPSFTSCISVMAFGGVSLLNRYSQMYLVYPFSQVDHFSLATHVG